MVEKYSSPLGSRVKLARIRDGVLQAELAKKVGVTQNYISMIETGRKTPSLQIISKIATELGVSASLLLEEDVMLDELRLLAKKFDVDHLIEGLSQVLLEHSQKGA